MGKVYSRGVDALIVKKVLNSSVVLTEDENEVIFLGKGIGFGEKRGMEISYTNEDQLFVPVSSNQHLYVLSLLESIDNDVIEITNDIVNMAKQKINQELAPRLMFVLMDYIDFMLKKLRKGIDIQNKLYWKVKNYYPLEFEISKQAVKLLEDKFNLLIPMVDDVMSIVRCLSNKSFKTNSLQYKSLLTDVKLFIERVRNETQYDTDDIGLINCIMKKYSNSAEIVGKIKKFILRKYNYTITFEESMFLIINIESIGNY